jgi:hypothetical protein
MKARSTCPALVIALLFTTGAFAAEPTKIDVQTEVVLAQEKGAQLDPPELSKMQQALKPKKQYGTMKRLSSSRLTLTNKPTPVSMPNGSNGELSLVSVKDDVAMVRLKVGALDSTLKLGGQGSLYQHAGTYQGGDLWVVLSRPK